MLSIRFFIPQIKNRKSKIKNCLLLSIALFAFPILADDSLTHNVGSVEMLVSDWGAFTRVEESGVYPNFGYSGKNYMDPFSEVWVGGAAGYVASAYDGIEGDIFPGEWLVAVPSGHLEYISDHPNASQSIHTQYVPDRYNDSPFSVTIDQYSYAWDSIDHPDDDDYIVMKLVLTNQDKIRLPNFFLAVQTNWDMDYNEEKDDLVDWDAERNAGISYDSDGTDTVYTALMLISGRFASHNIVDVNTWSYLDPDRAELMSNGETDDLKTIEAIPGNYFNVIATGPYDILPGESVSAIYAFVGGDGLDDLRKNMDAARKKVMMPGKLVAEPSREAIHLKWSPGIAP